MQGLLKRAMSFCPASVAHMIAFDTEDSRGKMGAMHYHHRLTRKPTEAK